MTTPGDRIDESSPVFLFYYHFIKSGFKRQKINNISCKNFFEADE